MKLLSPQPPPNPTSDELSRQTVRKPLPRFPPKVPKQVLIYGAIALIVLWLTVNVLRPNPVAVDLGRVESGMLQVTIAAEGKTRVKDRYVIAAGVDGHIDRITLNEGDSVKAGMIVARMDALPQTAAVQQTVEQLTEWRAQRAGVATQRPKAAALAQAKNRIAAAIANQQQAEARIAQAQAALAQAQRDRQRAQQLEASGAISQQQREQAALDEQTQAEELAALMRLAQAAASEVAAARDTLALLQAQQSDPDFLLRVYDARIASTEAELARLQDAANRTEMRSPANGKVLKVLQRSAQFISEGTPLLEVGDPSHLELIVDLLSTDAEKVQPGDPIWVTSNPDRPPLPGIVQRIEPAAFTKVSALGVEEQRVNVIGSFINSPMTLGDAYRVDVQIVVWSSPQVLKVPLSALFRCETAWCTFVVADGKARRRPVAVGHRSDTAAEIQQGLKAGENVILHPSEQINDGRRVAAAQRQ
ncbi:MAG TPA: HlyD family efflux transporter periplasmic adaptor subunit [Coleofasciculaceae cyanobacterium]